MRAGSGGGEQGVDDDGPHGLVPVVVIVDPPPVGSRGGERLLAGFAQALEIAVGVAKEQALGGELVEPAPLS